MRTLTYAQAIREAHAQLLERRCGGGHIEVLNVMDSLGSSYAAGRELLFSARIEDEGGPQRRDRLEETTCSTGP